MSEVLLQQLEHMLAPWPMRAASSTHTQSSTVAVTNNKSSNKSSDGDEHDTTSGVLQRAMMPVTLLPQYNSNNDDDDDDVTCVSDVRRTLTRLELARAALALFASNAGVYRPVLVKLLRFVFALVDHLVDERSRAYMTRAHAHTHTQQHDDVPSASSPLSSSPTARDDGDDGADTTTRTSMTTQLSSNDAAVARAYATVRRVEANMAALVDEAAAQRDRLQSQMATQAQHIAKLEQLLQHQMALTDALLLQQQLHPHDHVALTTAAKTTATAAASDASEAGGVRPVKRNAASVRQLIARAAREHALEQLDERVREQAAAHAQTQSHLDAVLRLNARYAQQAVELSARLSLLREHNIALAADAQLYQRDALLDRQRADKLAREVAAARAALLVWLETRQREALLLSAAQHQHNVAHQRRGTLLSSLSTATTATATTLPTSGVAPHMATMAVFADKDATAAAANVNAVDDNDDDDDGDDSGVADTQTPASCLVAHTERVLRGTGDVALRQQLQHILSVKDGDVGGAMKTALLSLLNVKRTSLVTMSLLDRDDTAAATAAASAVDKSSGSKAKSSALAEASEVHAAEAEAGLRALQLQLSGGHAWAAPRGCDACVPLHLRTSVCVPLLHFHSLVAECVVHELLVQRREFVTYYRTTDELQSAIRAALPAQPTSAMAAAVAMAATTTCHRSAADGGNSNSSSAAGALQMTDAAVTSACVDVPLDVFVTMFIRVVWLNDGNNNNNNSSSDDDTTTSTLQQQQQQQQQLVVPTTLTSRLHTMLLASTSARADAASCLRRGAAHAGNELPLEGLKLAYGLDAASRRSDAGVLTHVYGLVSRHDLSEVVLDVMRSERAVLLALCAAAEQQHVQSVERIGRSRGSCDGGGAALDDDDNDNKDSDVETKMKKTDDAFVATQRQGCVPTVQLARILALMYPGYTRARLEQLVLAATDDGANDAESPVVVYYSVLLPERQLPSAAVHESSAAAATTTTTTQPHRRQVGASTDNDGSTPPTTPSGWWQCGRFAALFYKSLCDDALESLQLLDDSLCAFARRKCAMGRRHCADDRHAARVVLDDNDNNNDNDNENDDEDDEDMAVTVQQWCTLALDGVPWHELQHWGPAVRAVMTLWASSRAAASAATTSAALTLQPPQQQQQRSVHEEAVWQTPVQQLMRYLRRHLLPRRGPLPPPRAPAQTTTTTAAAAANDGVDTEARLVSPEHAAYIRTLAQRWQHFCQLAQPALRGCHDAATTTAAAAAAASSSSLASLSQLARLLRQYDAQREFVWGTAHVAASSHLVRTRHAEVPTPHAAAAATAVAAASDDVTLTAATAAAAASQTTTTMTRTQRATRHGKRRPSRVRDM